MWDSLKNSRDIFLAWNTFRCCCQGRWRHCRQNDARTRRRTKNLFGGTFAVTWMHFALTVHGQVAQLFLLKDVQVKLTSRATAMTNCKCELHSVMIIFAFTHVCIEVHGSEVAGGDIFKRKPKTKMLRKPQWVTGSYWTFALYCFCYMYAWPPNILLSPFTLM